MNCFTKEHRLRKADEFSSVFAFRKVRVGKYFKLHYMPNSFEHSRLGFMVSKKVAKRANQRNYMKRFIREFFRTSQSGWGGVDLIVRVQKKFTQNEWLLVTDELKSLTKQFIKPC
ncbi:ribonuclease P protein component [Aquella oligotrophica]|uniref:Ribonuclease P protein component n=1 Tax=Aquella oligotrophica TaxID=2067065 RepID=A0A2I7N5S7_9NEIS|nr:ribonuclease P protein component [Aquella oligotrophica]AUR51792.1 ribonuclease P protein component [Aquella oligotrophica]